MSREKEPREIINKVAKPFYGIKRERAKKEGPLTNAQHQRNYAQRMKAAGYKRSYIWTKQSDIGSDGKYVKVNIHKSCLGIGRADPFVKFSLGMLLKIASDLAGQEYFPCEVVKSLGEFLRILGLDNPAGAIEDLTELLKKQDADNQDGLA